MIFLLSQSVLVCAECVKDFNDYLAGSQEMVTCIAGGEEALGRNADVVCVWPGSIPAWFTVSWGAEGTRELQDSVLGTLAPTKMSLPH